MTIEDDATTETPVAEDTPPSRRGVWHRLRSRPIISSVVGAAALAGLLVVLLWFQPQTLFIDDVVDEDFPIASEPGPSPEGDGADTEPATEPAEDAADETDEVAGDTDETVDPADETSTEADTTAQPEAPSEPVALASGSFTSLNRYTVVGEATTYELPDGSRVLRLEDFESTNGPDLYVYLSAADSGDGDSALDDDAVNLGVLSGNIGNQNYDIPADVDLDHYDTVVIWCLRFTTGFGAADLVSP